MQRREVGGHEEEASGRLEQKHDALVVRTPRHAAIDDAASGRLLERADVPRLAQEAVGGDASDFENTGPRSDDQ